MPSLEVVIPFYNEEQSIDLLISTLQTVFSSDVLQKSGIQSVHYICVDDGSTDSTPVRLSQYIRQGFPATLYILSRNFGHQNALSVGLGKTKAKWVAVIDADLQDPPELILEMVKKGREGYDVVFGERRSRKEFFLKVLTYRAFYRILSFLSEVKIPLDTGDFCLMDRRVVEAMNQLPEVLRFPRGLRAWVGFRQIGLPYDRPSRVKGATKYTFRKLYQLATNGIASMSIRVLQITQLFSFLFASFCFVLAIYALKLLLSKDTSNTESLWFLGGYILITLLGSVILFAMYIMSAYIGRTYLEVKARPIAIIRETLSRETLSETPSNETSASIIE